MTCCKRLRNSNAGADRRLHQPSADRCALVRFYITLTNAVAEADESEGIRRQLYSPHWVKVNALVWYIVKAGTTAVEVHLSRMSIVFVVV